MLSQNCPKCKSKQVTTTLDDFKSHFIGIHCCNECGKEWDSRHRISAWKPGMARFSIRSRQYKEDELVLRIYDAAADGIESNLFKKGETIICKDEPTGTDLTFEWNDLLPPGPGVIASNPTNPKPRIIGAEAFGF